MGFTGEGARARESLVVDDAALLVVVDRAFEPTLVDLGGCLFLLLRLGWVFDFFLCLSFLALLKIWGVLVRDLPGEGR